LKNINKFFTNEELEALEKIDVKFDPDRDYSDDELFDIHEKITDEFPYEYDDSGPKESGRMFEAIIDKFKDNFNI
jgi:hypothetical protein